MKIRVLPQEMIDKIAAGEVVERPASVVKELMENSLDANATQVLVRVGELITSMIEVEDNGEGMDREEVLTAIKSHATSKIADDKDLFAIKTLGFRGEALPSIATVSHMEIETRPRAAPLGVKVVVEAGAVRDVKEVGIPKGTKVQVQDLFYTTPARRKFLKSSTTEWAHVQDVFIRLCLARRDVHFGLWKEGRQWVNAPLAQDIRQRVGQVLGWDLGEKLYPFEAVDKGHRLYGMMARPDYHCATGRNIFFFVNGRWVRDLILQKALREAYRTYIPKDRFPVVLAFLESPFDQVDVNVHPTKLEVRFANASQVRSLLHDTLARMLRESRWDRKAIRSVTFNGASTVIKESSGDEAWEHSGAASPFPSSRPAKTAGDPPKEEYPQTGGMSCNGAIAEVDQDLRKELEKVEVQGSLWSDARYRFSSLRVLGQFRDVFLVCESDDHLLLIDQHAAHERVVFEKLRKAFCQAGTGQQVLLIPCVVELSPTESEVVARNLSDVSSWGIEAEAYGKNSFLVTALPALLSGTDPLTLLRDVAEELVEMEHVVCIEDLRDHVFARMACHSVIRGHRHMEVAEIQALLREMDEVDFSLSCPHGRPVIASWSLYDIEKRFHRT